MSKSTRVGPQEVNHAHRATVHEAPAKPAAPAAPAPKPEGRAANKADTELASKFFDKFNVGGRKLGGVFAPRANEVPSETYFSNDSLSALAGTMGLLENAQAAITGAVANVGQDEIPTHDTLDHAGGLLAVVNAMFKNQGIA